MAAIISVFVVWMSVPGAPTVVLVPERDEPQSCAALEEIAATLVLEPSLRVIRARPEAGEPLAHMRRRIGTDWAVSAQLGSGDRPQASVELHRAGRKALKRTAYGRAPEVLAALWPKDAPGLPIDRSFAAANPKSLMAACEGKASEALEASGVAIGEALLRRLDLPKDLRAGRGFLARWIEAESLLRAGKIKEAVAPLRTVVRALDGGSSIPTWRQSLPGREISAVQRIGDRAIVFNEGRFSAFDVFNGSPKWAVDVDQAEPELVDLGEGVGLALAEDGIKAIDLGSGRVLWQRKLSAPQPEIAVLGARIFVAAGRTVLALDKKSGRPAWEIETSFDPPAGPAAFGDRVALPADSAIALLSPKDGKILETIPVGDELASPLFVRGGQIFGVVGGDRIARLTPRGEPKLTLWKRELLGAEWPPVAVSDSILVAARHPKRGGFVGMLQDDGEPFIRVLQRGAQGPLHALPGGDGVVHMDPRGQTLFARDLRGHTAWQQRFPRAVTAMEVGAASVFVLAGQTVSELDAERGRTKQEIDLGGPVRAVTMSDDGGVAALVDGTIYGLPPTKDPRLAYWRRHAVVQLGQALLASGKHSEAKKLAERALAMRGDDLDALALLAGSVGKGNAVAGASAWYRIARHATGGDPLRAQALSELGRLVGSRWRSDFDAPISGVATSSVGDVVVLSGAYARGLGPTGEIRWRLRASKLQATGTSAVRVDDRLVGAASGKILRNLGPSYGPSSAFGLFRFEGKGGRTLVAEAAAGKVRWKQELEGESPSIVGANAEHVVVQSKDRVSVLDAHTGSMQWLRPFPSGVQFGGLSDHLVLFSEEGLLIGVESTTADKRFELKIPVRNLLDMTRFAEDFVLVADDQLVVISGQNGRSKRAIKLRSPPRSWVIDEQGRAFVLGEDGQLLAFDLATGRAKGRIAIEGASGIVLVGPQVLVIEDAGVVSFDAAALLSR